MGLQLLQLKLRLGKNPSRSSRPLKSAENFWQILELCSLRVPFALDRSWKSGSPPCGCLGFYLDDSLVPVMAYETKHRYEQKLNHLEEALPEAPSATTTAIVCNAYTRRVVKQEDAEQELFEIVKPFHACKKEESQSVSTYLLKMKGYLDQMERLGYPMPLVLGIKCVTRPSLLFLSS
ncbi:hypothetical protein Tco_0680681 [Tanacetum coccineum]|uniref:Zinc finger, CCHC-type n=1 Tax=Tanacetum coccineum TaxID=301880 RepID=A0ABQ4XMS5_9ASTR